jgi:hypothetical protein
VQAGHHFTGTNLDVWHFFSFVLAAALQLKNTLPWRKNKNSFLKSF